MTGKAASAIETHPGDRVRAVVKRAGLTVGDAAERVGVSRQQFTRLIGRKSAISSEMALRLESVFGLPAKGLLEMQLGFDLERARRRMKARLTRLRAVEGGERLTKDEVVRRLGERKAEFAAAGLARLYLFGSVARGEATANSDVDLYFEPFADASIGLVELGKLKARIEEILNDKVDLVPGDSFRPKVKARVMRDAVCIF